MSVPYVGSRAPNIMPNTQVTENPAIPLGDRPSASNTFQGVSFFAGDVVSADIPGRSLVDSSRMMTGAACSATMVILDGQVTARPGCSPTFLSTSICHFFRSFCSITSSRAKRSIAQMMIVKMNGARQPNLLYRTPPIGGA